MSGNNKKKKGGGGPREGAATRAQSNLGNQYRTLADSDSDPDTEGVPVVELGRRLGAASSGSASGSPPPAEGPAPTSATVGAGPRGIPTGGKDGGGWAGAWNYMTSPWRGRAAGPEEATGALFAAAVERWNHLQERASWTGADETARTTVTKVVEMGMAGGNGDKAMAAVASVEALYPDDPPADIDRQRDEHADMVAELRAKTEMVDLLMVRLDRLESTLQETCTREAELEETLEAQVSRESELEGIISAMAEGPARATAAGGAVAQPAGEWSMESFKRPAARPGPGLQRVQTPSPLARTGTPTGDHPLTGRPRRAVGRSPGPSEPTREERVALETARTAISKVKLGSGAQIAALDTAIRNLATNQMVGRTAPGQAIVALAIYGCMPEGWKSIWDQSYDPGAMDGTAQLEAIVALCKAMRTAGDRRAAYLAHLHATPQKGETLAEFWERYSDLALDADMAPAALQFELAAGSVTSFRDYLSANVTSEIPRAFAAVAKGVFRAPNAPDCFDPVTVAVMAAACARYAGEPAPAPAQAARATTPAARVAALAAGVGLAEDDEAVAALYEWVGIDQARARLAAIATGRAAGPTPTPAPVKAPATAPAPARAGASGGRDPRPVICYWCRSAGHMQAACPRFAAGEPRVPKPDGDAPGRGQ
jgi:hypothetical protein